MSDPLPRDTVTDWDGYAMRCPWCKDTAIGEAKVSLDDLLYTHHCGDLARAPRNSDQTASCDALSAECPSCGKPVIVAPQGRGSRGHPTIRLLAVRTEIDARFMFLHGPRSASEPVVNTA